MDRQVVWQDLNATYSGLRAVCSHSVSVAPPSSSFLLVVHSQQTFLLAKVRWRASLEEQWMVDERSNASISSGSQVVLRSLRHRPEKT